VAQGEGSEFKPQYHKKKKRKKKKRNLNTMARSVVQWVTSPGVSLLHQKLRKKWEGTYRGFCQKLDGIRFAFL
jgi:hypothetical protein